MLQNKNTNPDPAPMSEPDTVPNLWLVEADDYTQPIEVDVENVVPLETSTGYTAGSVLSDYTVDNQYPRYVLPAPEDKTRSHNPLNTLKRKVVAVGLATVAIVGVVSGTVAAQSESQSEAKSAGSATEHSVTHTVTERPLETSLRERILANRVFWDVKSNPSTYGDLNAYLDKLTPDAQGGLGDLRQDAAIAEGIDVAQSALYSSGLTQDEVVAKLPMLKDPETAQVAKTTSDYGKASEYIQDVRSGTDVDENAARSFMAGASPSVRQTALNAFDAEIARSAVQEASSGYDATKLDAAKEQLQSIADPSLRDAAKAAFDTADAVRNGDYSDTATERKYDARTAFDEKVNDRKTAFYDEKNALSQDITDQKQRLTDAYQQSSDKVMGLIKHSSESLPDVPMSKLVTVTQADLGKDLDFSTLGDGVLFHDYDDALDKKPVDKDNLLTPEVAEVYVEDGKIVFKLSENSGMKPESAAAIQRVVDNMSPLLTQAFKSGNLESIHFLPVGSDAEFNGAFNGASHRAYIRLLKTGMTMGDIQMVMTHEVIGHGLTMHNMDTASPEQRIQFNKACNVIRNTTYDNLRINLESMPSVIDAVADQAPADARPVMNELKRLVQSGELVNGLSATQTDIEYDPIWSNSCNSMGLEGAINQIARKLNISAPSGSSVSDYIHGLHTTQEYNELSAAWGEAESNYSIYTYLNEGKYMPNIHDHEKYEGHTQDNAYELAASLINVSLNRRVNIINSIRSMSVTDREAALEGISASLHTVGANTPPDVKKYFESVLQDIVAKVNE